ncbi:MAG: YihY/virulence factor BrkB family protein [Oscillospiraceae bacterium]|nr:YihY/virulence factor BrkB family protein [Oscillospiraceae bacterium]
MDKRALSVPLKIVEIYDKHKVPRSAAALSYYLLLSVFPFLICVNAMIGSLNLQSGDFLEYLQGYIPMQAIDFIAKYLDYVSGKDQKLIFIVGIVMMITASSAAFRSVTGSISEIQQVRRFSGLGGTLLSFVMSIIFLAVIYVTMLAVLFGQWIVSYIEQHIDSRFLIQAAYIWRATRFIIVFVLLYFMILVIYKLSAPVGRKMRGGALLASLALVADCVVFSNIIGYSVRYTLVYGYLASVILMMVWLYTCGVIIIMGSVFCLLAEKKSVVECEVPSTAKEGAENEEQSTG